MMAFLIFQTCLCVLAALAQTLSGRTYLFQNLMVKINEYILDKFTSIYKSFHP